MLSIMREKAGSWMIKIILGAIVIVFVFWGVGSFRSQRIVKVAEVNGTPISVESYQNAYNGLIERYRRQFGNSLNDEMIKMLGLKRQALDQLIDQAVLLQEAEKLNLRISDDQLARSIQEIPAFQRAGRFDNRAYAQVLAANRLTPEEFEYLQRDSMAIDRLRTYIMEMVWVSDSEAKEQFSYENQETRIEYALFSPEDMEGVTVTDEEVKAYYDENQAAYKTEPKVKAQYLHIDPATMTDQIEISEEEIKTYYDSHMAEYEHPKTVKARHILLKLDRDASPETVEEKRKQAEDLMNQARSGGDFAELARQHSEGPTREAGGDLGTFKKETMVEPFAEKAFSMAAGEISEPVRTQFGWHVIKVEGVNPASVDKLEDVSADIAEKLKTERAKVLARERIETIYDNVFEGDDLKEVITDPKLTVEATDFFTRSGPQGVAQPSRFGSVAFGLDLNQISDIQEMSDGFYLIQLVEKMPAQQAEFDAVTEQVRSQLLQKKEDDQAKAQAEEVLAQWKKEGESTDGEAPPASVEIVTSGWFKRGGEIPGLGGRNEAVTRAAFELSPEKPIHDGVIQTAKGYAVIRYKERKSPDPDLFDAEKKDIKDHLLRQKQFQTYNTWLSRIKQSSEIVIEETFLE